MEGLTEAVLEKIEKSNAEGLTSQQIVGFLDENGIRFSEAALRKYVQLGLLPHSVRVGRKGKHRGSQGLYPVSIVRQVLEIKRLLNENFTIGEIRQEYLLLRGEIEVLDQKLRQLFDGIEVALKARADDTASEHARRDLRNVRGTAGDLIGQLRGLETRLSLRAGLARVAL